MQTVIKHVTGTVIGLLFGFSLVGAGPATAGSDSPLPAPRQISKHVYAWIGPYEGPNTTNQGFRMNMAFVVGKNAVAVIDSGYTQTMAKQMLRAVAGITSVPIRYVINTNSQPHRFMGNSVFKDQGAEIIAHPESIVRMKKMSGDFINGIERSLERKPGSVRFPVLPDKPLTAPRNIDLGGIHIKVWNAGASHTPASLVVEIPADNVVYAGDLLFSGRLPAVLPDGNVKSWLSGFDNLRQWKNSVFIPGHGEPGELSNFEFPTYAYLKFVYTHMMKKVEEGADVQEAIDSLDQSAYQKLANYEQLAGRNASWIYLEVEAASF